MNVGDKPLIDSLHSWVSKSRDAQSLENRKQLDTLIKEVNKVSFESGLCEGLRDELSEVQSVVTELGKEEYEQLKDKIEWVKEHIFPEKVTDRLALCNKRAAQGWLTANALTKNFDKLGFLEDLRDCSSPEDRLDLCKEIAKQGDWAAKALNENFDKLGFLEDLQKCSSQEDRHALCKEIAKLGWWGAVALTKNFESLKLEKASVSDRLDLCKEIMAQGEWAARKLIWNFDKLGLKEASDRLALGKEIAAQGWWAANALKENFEKLGFFKDLQDCSSPEDRLALCKEIAKQGEWAAVALAWDFEKLGLKEVSVSDRLALCKEIIKQGELAAEALAENFEKLGFLKDLQKCSSLEVRLALCKKIAKQGEWAAKALTENFESLELQEALVSDRFDLSEEIVAQGRDAALALAKNFDKLGLQEAPASDRLDLCKEIAAQLGRGAYVLGYDFDKLGFLKDLRDCSSPEDRLALCKEIIKQGEWAAKALAKNFDKLGLEEASDRLDLCKEIIKQGNWLARAVVENFEKLGLKEVSVSDRLALCREIAKQGEEAAKAVVKNFESLKLKEASASDRLALCREIAKQGYWAATAVVLNFDKLVSDDSERIQILFELLTLPSEIRDVFKPLTNRDYVSTVKPFLSLLLQEEIDFDSYEFDEFEQRIAKTPIQSVYEEIKKQKAHRQQLSKWAAYSAGVLSDLEKEKSKAIEASKILDSIYHHQIPSNRFALVRQLKKLELKDLKMPDPSLEKGKNAARKQERSNLSCILLSRMEQIGFFNRDIERESILNKINGIRGFVDTKKFDSLMQLLLLVIEERPYKQEEIEMIEKAISSALTQLPKKSTQEVIKEEIPNALKQLSEEKKKGNKEVIEKIEKEILNKYAQLPKNTRKKDKTIIGVIKKEIPEADKKLLKLLSKPQKKQIDVISNKLHTMSNICKIFGKDELISCLKSEEDIQSFFQKKFQTLFELEELDDFGERYQETIGSFRDKTALFSYLRSVESLPPGDRVKVKKAFSDYVAGVLKGTFPSIRYDFDQSPHLKTVFEKEGLMKIWLGGKEPQKVAKAGRKSKPLQINYKAFLYEKILTDQHLKPDDFPYLRDYLQGEEVNLPKLDEPKVKFQALAIALCEKKKKAEDFVSEVEELKLSLGEFENDLKALVPQKVFGEYKISESDEPCDLLLVGTEIQGSCQRVNGEPSLNKCLAGYMMNGEIRPIVVKRGDKLVARSLLRLMWDDKNKTPVLLQERLYSNVQDESIKKAINEWAVDKAKRMGIPLVSKEIGKGESYDGTVKFLGGGAPFVYSDASGGVMSGAFETTGCHLLYMPRDSDSFENI